jgi:hypothetical protein
LQEEDHRFGQLAGVQIFTDFAVVSRTKGPKARLVGLFVGSRRRHGQTRPAEAVAATSIPLRRSAICNGRG